MIRVFGDWELIKLYYRKDKQENGRTVIYSLYRCKKCGEDKILRKDYFDKHENSRCPPCEKFICIKIRTDYII